MTRREMNRMSSLVVGWAAASVASGSALAGPVPRIAHTLIGTVVLVDAIARSLTVQARHLEAWMGAITTIYSVDNPKLLREVKVGDQIMGKVYDGETALRHVEIVAVAARPAAEAS
jgi:hypothetical protein